MDEGTFETWLAAYGRAWETRDPEAAARLFTEDATYHETSFGEPMRGREEIRAVTENEGISRWCANFVRVPSGAAVRLDGVCLVTRNADGLCTEFREWWHKKE